MKRAICIVCMVIICGSSASSVFGASARCTVEKVDGGRLVLDCGKKAADFQKGTAIKVKSVRKAAVEGC